MNAFDVYCVGKEEESTTVCVQLFLSFLFNALILIIVLNFIIFSQ